MPDTDEDDLLLGRLVTGEAILVETRLAGSSAAHQSDGASPRLFGERDMGVAS